MSIRLILVTAALAMTSLAAQVPPAEPPPVVPETLAVQIMLDRAGFSPGEIDSRPGINVRRALEAFQRAHGLAASGMLDDATWDRLAQRTGHQPPLVRFDITPDVVGGPFEPAIPSDMMAQAKLKALAYREPLEALAEKFHVSPALLKQLNPVATFTTAGERVLVPNVAAINPQVPAPGTRPAARLVVTKETSALTIEDAAGNVIFHAPVTTGSRHDPLPVGEWKVTGVQQMPEFRYNPALFWDANPAHTKARIAPGPNNPVGVVWIGLSKEHYGIHGTPEPSRIGHVQSHGCVRLTNWDAQRVAIWSRPGTQVIFR